MKVCALSVVLAAWSAFGGRVTESFNAGWEFEEKGKAAVVGLPHDWAIAGPFDPQGWGATGRLPWKDRTATYRKTLVLPKGADGKRHFFRFDGAMAHATAFVNGYPAGRGDYGYLGFAFDATPYLRVGTNTVEVRVDTCNMKSRFYCGGGLYRNTWHVTTDEVRFDGESVFVQTPEVSSESAQLVVTGRVRSHLASASSATVTATLRNPDGKVVARCETKLDAAAFAGTDFRLSFSVAKPRLWQLKPAAALYTLELGLTSAAGTDGLTKRVGFRTFRFDADRGFFLNGERVQLNGVNLHSDLGPLGMAVEKGAIRRQLEVMRDMGANAIRTSHNPPSPEFLDLCDEMGFFVWDETFDKWNETCGRGDEPLEEFVPRQLRKHVLRDRNHPCVFVWSIGNEITSNGECPPGQESWAGAREMGTTPERCAVFRGVVRALDATRPVGIGCCFKSAIGRGDYAALDLTGWNYSEQYRAMREAYPAKPVIYSESASAVSSFGYYADLLPTNKTDYGENVEAVDSYDRTAAPWADIPDREFERMERDTFCAGEFVWTGIDYLGEPTPRDARSSYFGICDLLALPKDRYFLYRSHWNKKSFTLHLVPHHWNFKRGRVLPVYAYTSADEAELFVNGKSFGRRRKNPEATMKDGYYAGMARYRLIWEEVAYEPGEIKVVAYGKDGQVLGSETLRTAGPVAAVRVDYEMPYDDLVFARVTAVDAKGTPVLDATNRVTFAVEGPAKILAVGNADPFGMDSFKDVSSHRLYYGRLGVYLKRTGEGPVSLDARLVPAEDQQERNGK